MLRFASSPTGDMHINDLRVALYNYLLANKKNEDLVIRIEDSDNKNNIEGKDQEILDLLALFNIHYSQVIYQSQNARFHAAMALQLLHEKKAFSCFCSPEWIEQKKQEAKTAQKNYHYDDACRNLPAELVIDNTAPFTIRIVRPSKSIVFHDKIVGDVSFDPDSVDSFTIMHQDKTATSDFASAIDDMLSDISIVVCEQNYLQNTSRQIHIRNQLAYKKEIEYAHIPIITNKSDNDMQLNVKWLLEEGFLPEAISNYLISIGNETPSKIFTLDEAQEWFTLETLTNSPTHFDINVLKHINREHLKMMDSKELSRYVGFADTDIGELAKVYLQEAVTTKELKSKIAPIFDTVRNIPKNLEKEVQLIAEAIKQAPYFENYDEFTKHIIKETEVEGEKLIKSLHVLFTNREDGPEISKIYDHLKNYLGEIIK